jgi:hypothetical protein
MLWDVFHMFLHGASLLLELNNLYVFWSKQMGLGISRARRILGIKSFRCSMFLWSSFVLTY